MGHAASTGNKEGAMPLLGRWKRNKEDKERTRRQLNLGRHSPLPAVDLSNCSLRCMPAEAYVIVRHMLKEVLLAHSNHLRSLADEDASYDSFSKMACILAMDFHCNEIAVIPTEIGKLALLQELNLSSNYIEELPESIGRLTHLRKLTISNNRLKAIPQSVGDCASLQHLDARHNDELRQLPSSLGRCAKLDELYVDAQRMHTPPTHVCEKGVSAMLEHLRAQGDFVDAKGAPCSAAELQPKSTTYILDAYYRRLSDTALCQMTKKDSANQLVAASEQNLLERFSERAKSSADLSKEQKSELMKQISVENALFATRMDNLSRQKQMDRKELMQTVVMLEQTTVGLIAHILANSHSAQLLDDEQQRWVIDEQWFQKHWQRHKEVRIGEIQRAMAAILNENVTLRNLYDTHQSYRDEAVAEALLQENGSGVAVDNALNERTRLQREMCDRLIYDEQMQKDALLCLMEQRDARTRQMSYQIEMIENELTKMSMLERANRTAIEQNYSNRLESQRRELTQLLMELMRERDLRAKELRQQLDAMERDRQTQEADFWLRRYQALLDTKPLELTKTECLFDTALVKMLNAAGAADYAPNLARHNITQLSMLVQLKEADLIKMGVDNVGARKRLVELAAQHRHKSSIVDVEKKLNTAGMSSAADAAPSAPAATAVAAPPLAVARFEVECVVCLDKPAVRLLAPCGHVCACSDCAAGLRQCPLCRSAVQSIVDLPETDIAPQTL